MSAGKARRTFAILHRLYSFRNLSSVLGDDDGVDNVLLDNDHPLFKTQCTCGVHITWIGDRTADVIQMMGHLGHVPQQTHTSEIAGYQRNNQGITLGLLKNLPVAGQFTLGPSRSCELH